MNATSLNAMNDARPTDLPKGSKVASWIAQLVAAVIMGQTLFFKFTAAPEPVAIFEKLGVEPWGRIGTGVLELVAVLLLVWPRAAALGGALTVALMGGAVMSHLTLLGIEVAGDGGTLFAMALVTLAAGSLVTWLRRADLPLIGERLG